MKTNKFLGYTLALLTLLAACEQETIETTAPEQDLTNVGEEPNCEGATAGSANFTKYIAIGNSLTAGFQAGALFTEGQNNSLANILANHFRCAGGGDFNQPDINSENGFLFTGTPNPLPNGVVLGRLLLQGTPAAPSPTISNPEATPSPQNSSFSYAGDKAALNNFGVPGITLLHIFRQETGDWNLIDIDPAPGLQPHPLFNPFYARFASEPGATIIGDALTALSNGGTFFSFWLGNNDVLGYAIGGASDEAIFTPVDPVGLHPGFRMLFNNAIDALLSVPDVKGVVGNIPDVTVIPYFTTVPYNAIPLDNATATVLNMGFAGYNTILDALKGPPFNYPATELDARKVSFAAGTNNNIVINDETLNDLGDEFDMLQGAGIISANQRTALAAYEQVRQATSTDLITLSAGSILGKPVGGNSQAINGLTVPLGDQYVLIPSEITVVKERIASFNTIIADKVANSNERLALADVNTTFNQLATARAQVVNGVAITPSLAPPTGGFSEDGVHPNSRGMAFMANIFIEAINAKFGATLPKVNLSKYKATALPVNP